MQWAVIALSALCVGMSKTGVQGIMLMIVPLLAMAFGAKESTGIILPMLCMADIIQPGRAVRGAVGPQRGGPGEGLRRAAV